MAEAMINGGRGVWVIVPAAGSGQRMGADLPKQYLPINGEPMLLHTLRALSAHSAVSGIQLALSADDRHWPEIADNCRAGIGCPIRDSIGGGTRAESVLAALSALPDAVHAHDWLLVHDAARPCLTLDDLDRLIAALQDDCHGAILAAPITDTVKVAGRDSNRIERTLPREHLWRALTPQAARRGQLDTALRRARQMNAIITDEASALEATGQSPLLVPGRGDNIKVTTPEDLKLAAWVLARED